MGRDVVLSAEERRSGMVWLQRMTRQYDDCSSWWSRWWHEFRIGHHGWVGKSMAVIGLELTMTSGFFELTTPTMNWGRGWLWALEEDQRDVDGDWISMASRWWTAQLGSRSMAMVNGQRNWESRSCLVNWLLVFRQSESRVVNLGTAIAMMTWMGCCFF